MLYRCIVVFLTHNEPSFLFVPPENIRKTGSLMLSDASQFGLIVKHYIQK